jgi:hypothetical protein
MYQGADVTECRVIGCEAEAVAIGLGWQRILRVCSRTPAIVSTDAHLLIVKIDGYRIALWQFVDVPGFFEVSHREGPGTDVDCGHADSDEAYTLAVGQSHPPDI